MNAQGLRACLLALVVIAVLVPGEAPAQTPLGSLYEVTENASLRLKKKQATRSATAALFGFMASSAPICPPGLSAPCGVVVLATDRIDLATGKGPVEGTFSVVITFPSDNEVDAPEGTVAEGSLTGMIDLSPALLDPSDPIPLGFIAGTWEVKGAKGGGFEKFKNKGRFTGVFRLPFVVAVDGPALYLLGDPASPVVVPVALDEHSLGWPTVRLDIKFTSGP